MILHDASNPIVERGLYCLSYCEIVDGYRHAYWDERKYRVRYSRTADHPADPRCPGCAEMAKKRALAGMPK